MPEAIDTELKVVRAVPSLILHLLYNKGANIYLFRYRVKGPGITERYYIERYDDIHDLPDGAYIYKEKVSGEEFYNLDTAEPTIFFKAILGAIRYEGNTRDGYHWEIRRPVMTLTDAITHYSNGWELHDLWGDIEQLMSSDGSYALLRNTIVLRDFIPPENTLEAFHILYSKFGNAVFDKIEWGDMEPYRVKSKNKIPDAVDVSQTLIATPSITDFGYDIKKERFKHKTYLRVLTNPPTAIYSIQRGHVIWGAYNSAINYYHDINLAIDNFGIPVNSARDVRQNIITLKPHKISYYREVLKNATTEGSEPRYEDEADYWATLTAYFYAKRTESNIRGTKHKVKDPELEQSFKEDFSQFAVERTEDDTELEDEDADEPEDGE